MNSAIIPVHATKISVPAIFIILPFTAFYNPRFESEKRASGSLLINSFNYYYANNELMVCNSGGCRRALAARRHWRSLRILTFLSRVFCHLADPRLRRRHCRHGGNRHGNGLGEERVSLTPGKLVFRAFSYKSIYIDTFLFLFSFAHPSHTGSKFI